VLVKKIEKSLKKNQSKQRNILRKLLRFSASLGNSSGEYGIISANDVELICANCQLEDLTEMNAAMGGEPASKESSLLVAAGFEIVYSKLASVKEINDHLVEDERIAKEAAKKEKEEAAKPKKKVTEVKERELTEEQSAAIAKCVLRYQPGLPNRWQSIANYLNVILSPEELFTSDECLRAAYIQAHPSS